MITSINEYRNYDKNVLPYGLTPQTMADRVMRATGEDFEYQTVKVKYIIPPTGLTPKGVFSTQELPQLIKYGDKYWVISGEAKIVQSVAAGLKKVDADVLDATNTDWLFDTPKKQIYSTKANESLNRKEYHRAIDQFNSRPYSEKFHIVNQIGELVGEVKQGLVFFELYTVPVNIEGESTNMFVEFSYRNSENPTEITAYSNTDMVQNKYTDNISLNL